MPQADHRPLYQSSEVLLLRAAARTLSDTTASWPEPSDAAALRRWLESTWRDPALREAVACASPSLAMRIEHIAAGSPTPQRRLVAAAVALTRYLLRAAGRPTPFGLFAGVAAAQFGGRTLVRFGSSHQAAARCDAAWLQSVIERCEASEPLLSHLTVVFSTLALARGGRWELPAGPDRQVIRDSPAVQTVRDMSASPIEISELLDRLGEAYPGSPDRIRSMIRELIRLGFLITNLQPPMTETNALEHLIQQLRAARARGLPELAGLLEELEALHRSLGEHNAAAPTDQAEQCAYLTRTITEIAAEGRTPLCLDLRLDAEVTLPNSVGEEMTAAASALIRLSPSPAGSPVWEDYHRRFVERYGTATLVPLLDVIDPCVGLGFPAGYPTSILPLPAEHGADRHEHLAQLITGAGEVTLTDPDIDAMTGSLFDPDYIPSHVEIAARIQAASAAELDEGRYTLHISPARAAGTLTSRFSALAAGSGLEHVFRTVPAIREGAHTVQLSVPPLFIRGQNIARTPAYLPDLLSLGEYRHGGMQNVLTVEDLAVTATLRGLHLALRETGQVIEPQVFHPLDLEKQLPPLGRFLAHLPRAFVADYLVFDWGPYRRLPHLPAVRYRRSILSPEQWRLTSATLAPKGADLASWRGSLDAWRERTGCPRTVQLHNGDQTLRLDLDEPMHALCLREHLNDDKPAIMTVARGPADYGWIDGHAHEVALPLTRCGRPASAQTPPRGVFTPGVRHGEIPAASRSRWLSTKLFTSPDTIDEILSGHLPTLIEELGADEVWFIRYRNREETDHIRLRIAADRQTAACRAAAVAAWVEDLRERRLCSRFTFDTYYPEVGRYGAGESMRAAETVFAADSATATAQLHRPPGIDPVALTALGMFDIAAAFCGGVREGAQWLADRRLPPGKGADTATTRTATVLTRAGELSSFGTLPNDLGEPWRHRAQAVSAYRKTLEQDADTTHVLESLLHIHHNRYRGIDRDGEQIARRLTRQLALAWRHAHHEEHT